MRYRFYTTSESALRGMLAGIANAHRSIFLEMYIFEDDEVGESFLVGLAHKAREGVRVIVILDAVGSYDLTSAAIERLRAASAEVLFFSYWFRRTHRKLLIIDEETVFLGGVNISRRFVPWKDLQVHLTGRRIASSALRSFARVYRECGGVDPSLRAQDHRPVLSQTRLWFLDHGVGARRKTLHAYYEHHIDHATRSITLVTPYLIPHRRLIAHLHTAILRGVRVEIILPRKTDHQVTDRLNAHYLGLLTTIGVIGYYSDAMNHAKVMLIDDREGTVGSQNLDALSFDWNAEASVFFDDPKMVTALSQIISKWKQESVCFDKARDTIRWYDWLIASFLRIFQPVL